MLSVLKKNQGRPRMGVNEKGKQPAKSCIRVDSWIKSLENRSRTGL